MQTPLSPNMLRFILTFAFFTIMVAFIGILIAAPLSPWFATLYIILKLSPLFIGALYISYQWVEKYFTHQFFIDFPHQNLRKQTHVLFSSVIIISIITIAFLYNYRMDAHLPIHHNLLIQKVDYTTSKRNRHYFVTVPNPNSPLLSFLPEPTIDISIQNNDANHIITGQTEIELDIFAGALGMPWIHNYRYHLTNKREDTSSLRHQTTASNDIITACHWRDNFNITTEIGSISPENYERNFWPNGSPRAMIPMVNGEKHGIEHDTFANGAVYADVPWKHGKKHGTFTLYREDGTVEQKLSYKDGEPYGINQWFDTKGNLSQEWLYLSKGKILPTNLCR